MMGLASVAAVGQALGDVTRLRVLATVDGRLAVGEIAEAVGITSATTSYHLGVLERGGLIALERRGRRHVPRRVPDAGLRLVRALG
jgi:DNA-binding transcriptional ArsR family regulator